MSDTEIRMMRYTIEQLSAELQAIRQYAIDIKTELERTHKALDVAVDALKWIAYDENEEQDGLEEFAISQIYKKADEAIKQITALEQKDTK